jgi:DtxR family Mn-dependent transcriptional regulator
MYSEAVQDYLKAVYKLSEREERVTTTALAQRLEVAPASVTNMLKRLKAMRLVDYEPYHGAKLTLDGRRVALELIRRHRLAESYLAEELHVPWHQVHTEAERLEHALSGKVLERMDDVLGHPSTDPHGAPIPTAEGTVAPSARTRLSELKAGQTGVVAEVIDYDPALLRQLGRLGLYPGIEVRLVARNSIQASLIIRVAEKEHILDIRAGEQVWVTPV